MNAVLGYDHDASQCGEHLPLGRQDPRRMERNCPCGLMFVGFFSSEELRQPACRGSPYVRAAYTRRQNARAHSYILCACERKLEF